MAEFARREAQKAAMRAENRGVGFDPIADENVKGLGTLCGDLEAGCAISRGAHAGGRFDMVARQH